MSCLYYCYLWKKYNQRWFYFFFAFLSYLILICDHFSLPAFFFIPILSSISPSCTSTFISHSLSTRDIHFSCETSASALWSFPLPFNFIYGLFYTRHLRRRLLLLHFSSSIHPWATKCFILSLTCLLLSVDLWKNALHGILWRIVNIHLRFESHLEMEDTKIV